VRPGENLFEELASDAEAILPTAHPKIRVWRLPPVSASSLDATLRELSEVIDSPRDRVLEALARAVPEYAPASVPVMRVVRDDPAVAA
jgi:FlaA1/EpsC-like NDP-sugar epimerase